MRNRKIKNIASVLLVLISISTNVLFAQNNENRITITKNNISLKRIFNSIEKQSNYSFIYNSNDIRKHTNSIQVNIDGFTIKETLDYLKELYPINFLFVGNNISVLINESVNKELTISGVVFDKYSGEKLIGVYIYNNNFNICGLIINRIWNIDWKG